MPAGLDGDFFIYIRTDALGVVNEGPAEGNNDSALAQLSIIPPYADLIVEAVTAAPSDALSGRPLTVSWRVRNVGIAPTNVVSWSDRVILSDDDVLDAGDTTLTDVLRTQQLDVDANYTVSVTLTLPEGIEGTFHLFVEADANAAADGKVFERQFEDNNVGRTPAPINVTRRPEPDLQVTAVTAPSSGQPGQPIVVQWTVTNVADGAHDGPAEGSWVDRVYLSTDGTLNNATVLAEVSREGPLPKGENYPESVEVVLPVVLDGSYTILLVTDAENQVYEGGVGSNDDNNVGIAPDPLIIPHADLVPEIASAADSATGGETLTVQWRVTNRGTAPAQGGWVDRIYLSEDATLGAGDRLLGERERSAADGPLGIDEAYDVELDVTLPRDISGRWHFIVQTDARGQVIEPGGEANNRVFAPIDIAVAPYADLSVADVSFTPSPVIGDPAEVTVNWTVANNGTGRGFTDTWVDAIIVSGDDVLGNADDQLLGEFTHQDGLDVTENYTRNETFLLPRAITGRYHLFVHTDSRNEVFENQLEADNTAIATEFFDVMTKPYADLVVLRADRAR